MICSTRRRKSVIPVLRLTASDNMGPVHVEGCEVGPGAAPLVFVFDTHLTARAGGHGGMGTVTRLDARLLVRRNDELVIVEGLALPSALIPIKDGCRLLSEPGVAGEEPGSMLPETNRVLGKPPPDRAATDGADLAGFLHIPRELRPAPSRRGHSVRRRQLTGESFDLHDDLWGETRGRPGRSRSSSPASRRSKKRLRHFATTSR